MRDGPNGNGGADLTPGAGQGDVWQGGDGRLDGGIALPSVDCGFVFAATGADYTVLARKAARNLRAVMPGAAIDLFTDQSVQDPVFDVIHRLSDSFFRPKMEAMQRSRFERMVYLDADTIVVADLSDLFRLLDVFDIAAAHALHRGRPWGVVDQTIPTAFPQVNGGLIALRRSETALEFLAKWDRIMRQSKADADQPIMRRLLYDSDLRLGILPPEYNLFRMNHLDWMDQTLGAPRMLHVQALHHRPPGDPEVAFNLDRVLGAERAEHVRNLIAAETALGGDRARMVPSLIEQRRANMTFGKRLRRRLARLLPQFR